MHHAAVIIGSGAAWRLGKAATRTELGSPLPASDRDWAHPAHQLHQDYPWQRRMAATLATPRKMTDLERLQRSIAIELSTLLVASGAKGGL